MCILQRIKTVCPVCRSPKPHHPSRYNPIPHVIPCNQNLAAANQFCAFPTNFDDITVSSVGRCPDCEDLFVDGQGRIADMFLVVDEHAVNDNNKRTTDKTADSTGGKQEDTSIKELAQSINITVKNEKKKSKKKSKAQRQAAAAAAAAGIPQVESEGSKSVTSETPATYGGGLSIGDVMAVACERNPHLRSMMEAELRKMQENPETLPRKLKVISTATEASRGPKLRL